MRGVRRYAGGGARPDGVRLPQLCHAAGAPAGAHASAAAAPAARVPCGGCGAVLAVPRGTRRLLACPLCGAEIDIDGRERFAAYSGVQVISPLGTVVLAATSSRLPEVGCLGRSHRIARSGWK